MSLLSIAARLASRTAQENPDGLPAPAPPAVGQQQQEGQQEQVGYIKHEKGKGYCVKSEKNPDWSGGCYPSHGKAEKRLEQVEKFKHMKKGAVTPEDIIYDLKLIASMLDASQRPDVRVVVSDIHSVLGAMRTAEIMGQQQQQADWEMTLKDPDGDEKIEISPSHQGQQEQQEETAKAPPGWKKTVEHMKDEPEIDNPFALAWYMKNKGDKPHKK